MSLFLAVLVALAHAGLAPVIVVAGVHPNLLLLAVVMAVSLSGFPTGLSWAFVGGLVANLFVGDALGSIPLGLLAVAALVSGAARLLARFPWIYPVLAVFAASLVADGIAVILAALMGGPFPTAGLAPTIDLALRAAVLNAAIGAFVLIPARALASRPAHRVGLAW